MFSDVDRDAEGIGSSLEGLFFDWAEVVFFDGRREGALRVARISELKDTIELLLDDLRELKGIEASTQLFQFLEPGVISELAGLAGPVGWWAGHRFF